VPSNADLSRRRLANTLRAVVRYMLEENEEGRSFSLPIVAANSSTRCVDANLPTGQVPETARRLVSNLTGARYLVRTGRKYKVADVAYLRRLLRRTPDTDKLLFYWASTDTEKLLKSGGVPNPETQSSKQPRPPRFLSDLRNHPDLVGFAARHNTVKEEAVGASHAEGNEKIEYPGRVERKERSVVVVRNTVHEEDYDFLFDFDEPTGNPFDDPKDEDDP